LRLRSVVAGLVLGAGCLGAQERITITDAGPGAGGRILQSILSRPHRVIAPDTGAYELSRGTAELASLVVLGRTARISGTVNGDVIVVGGNLFVRPGARISGRAIAIGGGVYASRLALVSQGTQSFYDYTYEIFRTSEGYRLDYRSLREGGAAALTFPGFYGLRQPEYDRVNGASISFGPAFSFASGNGEINAVGTYRSDLGKVDPLLYGTLQLNPQLRVIARAERGTFSNETWIWSDLVNSVSALLGGTDTRNYYRADRADAFLFRAWLPRHTRIEPFVGARTERARSVGPGFDATGGPWSLFNRTDSLGMRRPNPAVVEGTISSVLTGGTVTWENQGVEMLARSRAEFAYSVPGGDEFAQIASDFEVRFPTFSDQQYLLEIHWITTPGSAVPPPQRFHYLGGSGTLSFIDLLSQGGDELLFVDQRYLIPLPSVRLGLLGSPALQLRHRLGSAGIGDLPDFEQTIGIALALSFFRGEIRIDPADGDMAFGVGFSFSR
jgi:hypothetical protein